MSRHPSPTPSNLAAQPLSALRQKQKPFAVGTAAGADDVIYQAKYKELKRKVKDIESVRCSLSSTTDAYTSG